MPFVEVRGNSIRVKWWAGGYRLSADGSPTKVKKYESASGPEPGAAFTDEDEAYNYGLDREYDVRHGKHVRRADSKTLMEKYCWLWLEAQDLRPITMKGYKTRLNARIIPYWGRHAVGDITTWEFEAWKKTLKAEVERGELSDLHCNSLLSLFNMLMNDAVAKYKLRAESPVITQRRRGRYKKKRREKKRPLEMEVLHHLASNAHTVWGYTGWAYIWTLAFTGMRPPGEMVALRREYASPNWPASEPDKELREEALDRYAKMPALRVQHQLQYVDAQRTLLEPKYESHRTLVVPPFLHEMHVALLASHDSPWVFPARGGEAMGSQWTRDYWKPMRDGAPARVGRSDRLREEILAVGPMVGKRPYLLRHGHKEWLDEDRHSRVAVETRMGHEVAGLEGLYGNLTPGMERAIAESLQERWETFWSSGPWWAPPFPTVLPSQAPGPGESQLRSGVEALV
ncbi:integrase [Streptomyces sp. NPDC006640]|uniref:integrase n=1 Tax=Streptomyces sp. NPDC006640 TaxID=3364754 RepID=UPI0036A1C369